MHSLDDARHTVDTSQRGKTFLFNGVQSIATPGVRLIISTELSSNGRDLLVPLANCRLVIFPMQHHSFG